MDDTSVKTAAVAEQSSAKEGVAPLETRQSAQENSRFAAVRRRAEAEALAKAKQELAPAEQVLSALKELGLQGEDAVAALRAARAAGDGMSVSQANRIRMESLFQQHLAAIKAEYPETAATHVGQLGEEYLALMKSGFPDPVAAYEAQLALDRRRKKSPPPSAGAAGGSACPEKEFYTSEEVDRLTGRQLDDPKILERVIKSMSKWR